MDRSFLSQTEVIAASRRFVCIRLMTYEDEAEMKFLARLGAGRGGAVENTTFTILAPDGKELLRASRGPREHFGNASAMAAAMDAIAQRYPPVGTDAAHALPVTLTVPLGLDVAASDSQPLIVVCARDTTVRRELESKIAALAWSEPYLGQFTYAVTPSLDGMRGLTNLPAGDGVAIIEPDTFGQKGKVVDFWSAKSAMDQLESKLSKCLSAHVKEPKSMGAHRRAGEKVGAFWETKLAVTDREEAGARARTKRMLEQGTRGPE